MNDRTDYPKSNLAILNRKKGADGSSYFVGHLGLAMVSLTRLPEPNDKGEECWILKLSNPPKRDSSNAERGRGQDQPDRRANTSHRSTGSRFDAVEDKDIPF